MKFLLSIIFEYYDTENFDKWGDFRSFPVAL